MKSCADFDFLLDPLLQGVQIRLLGRFNCGQFLFPITGFDSYLEKNQEKNPQQFWIIVTSYNK